MTKNAIYASVFSLILVSAILIVRTLMFGADQTSVDEVTDIRIDQNVAAKRLSEALRIETVSMTKGTNTDKEFIKFHEFLETTFVGAHSELDRETVNGYSLLYTWRGDDPKLKPIMFLAHIDVVPINIDSINQWTHPPFAGTVADNYIWGRGALDMKQSLMALMEAVEHLVDDGFKPNRTVYLAFGHDEETGGHEGAAKIAELLETRNVQLDYTVDEGSAIVEGVIPGMERPVALVGLAEKGHVTLELTASGEGGHGSMPPMPTAVGKLARAIHQLESHPMPAEIRKPFSYTFEYLAPELPFMQRMALANRWLFQPLLIHRLENARSTNAAIRSTGVITMLKGSNAYNVLPTEATAVGNFRILPGDSIESVIKHVRSIANDKDISVEKMETNAADPSRISAIGATGFAAIDKTIRQVFLDVVVAPGLVVTGTDSVHYEAISENNYRFVPMRIGAKDIRRIHGIDERIGIDNYAEIIRFYIQLLRNAT